MITSIQQTLTPTPALIWQAQSNTKLSIRPSNHFALIGDNSLNAGSGFHLVGLVITDVELDIGDQLYGMSLDTTVVDVLVQAEQ